MSAEYPPDCPRCRVATKPAGSGVSVCPRCDACATWDPWCGSTDQGFYDGGPAYWQGIGWVSADEAPLPHVDVVGWYGREDVRVVRHDGRDWDGPVPLFWCALPPDPA